MAAFRDSGDAESSDWQNSVVVGLQEVPRTDAGWKTTECEGWRLLQYRSEDAWRGVALAYNPQQWTLMKKKQGGRGFWARLRHVQHGVDAWFGSFHFTQGCPQIQHASEVEEALSALPATTLPVLLSADTNASLGWTTGDKQHSDVAYGLDGKGVRMLEAFGSRSLRVVGIREGQENLPTSRPRKSGVKGNVIDVIAGARVRTGPLLIARDSHSIIGTDHEAVMCMVYLRGSGACPKRYDCRPRAVTKSIPVSTFLDQMALTTMARECTKPQASQGYKDSDEVKALFAAAKQASTANAWKQAHEARKKARLAWEHAKLDEASQGNWKEIGRARRTLQPWEDHFADVQDGKPHEKVHAHFCRKSMPGNPWKIGWRRAP